MLVLECFTLMNYMFDVDAHSITSINKLYTHRLLAFDVVPYSITIPHRHTRSLNGLHAFDVDLHSITLANELHMRPLHGLHAFDVDPHFIT